jgi:glycosyltransferase involved in cell wall biosynthesis
MVTYVLRRTDIIVCDADHIVPVLRTLGASRTRVEVVYFGVDVDRFRPMPPDPDWQKRLDILGCRVVMSLRHLLPVYDIPTLVRAIPRVVEGRPDVRFVIFGKGTEEERIRELVGTTGMEPFVRYGGWYDGDDLPRILSLATVYVSTSMSDAGLAASTGEAMACGVPPVVTDFGDNGLWVRPGENGALFPVGDPQALADALAALLDDPAQCAAFGERSRAIIVDRYNWATEMGRMEELYREAARRDRGA